jgi:hypothetical protein
VVLLMHKSPERLNIHKRKCKWCKQLKLPSEYPIDKFGKIHHVCTECKRELFKKTMSISGYRNTGSYNKAYNIKKVDEPCIHCNSVINVKKYHGTDLPYCDNCYTMVNNICGHIGVVKQ